MTLDKAERKYVECLTRRREYLLKCIKGEITCPGTSYDKAECAALTWILGKVSA